MLPENHSLISLPFIAVTVLMIASYVDAEHFYPKCFTPSGATRNPRARARCAFRCPLEKKHTVCGTDGNHYHNECFLCRHACVKPTLSKACDGSCPCKHHKNHVGRQAVHQNTHLKGQSRVHMKHGQVNHHKNANGKKRKIKRYKLRRGVKRKRKKKVYANETMRNKKNYRGRIKYVVKHKNGYTIKKKVGNIHMRMKGHRIIVKKGRRKGKYVYTNQRNIQKLHKNNRPKWFNGFGKAIQQWSHQGNGRRNHNAFAKITNKRYKGRAGKRTVYKISKKGVKRQKAYRKKAKTNQGKRYGFFKKRMLRSRRKRKRRHKH